MSRSSENLDLVTHINSPTISLFIRILLSEKLLLVWLVGVRSDYLDLLETSFLNER